MLLKLLRHLHFSFQESREKILHNTGLIQYEWSLNYMNPGYFTLAAIDLKP